MTLATGLPTLPLMNVETLVVGPFAVNCYVVWSNGPGAVVIDPGSDARRIADVLGDRGLRAAAYLLTHGHVDHVGALADLHDQQPAPVVLHSADAAWAFGPANCMPPYFNEAPRRPAAIDRVITDGYEGVDAELAYTVIATPGHSPGSVCYWFEKERALFSGDLLFAGSIGRTDLHGSDDGDMGRSLARIASLPDMTVVYPGHGPATDLAAEKRSNPYLRSFTPGRRETP